MNAKCKWNPYPATSTKVLPHTHDHSRLPCYPIVEKLPLWAYLGNGAAKILYKDLDSRVGNLQLKDSCLRTSTRVKKRHGGGDGSRGAPAWLRGTAGTLWLNPDSQLCQHCLGCFLHGLAWSAEWNTLQVCENKFHYILTLNCQNA